MLLLTGCAHLSLTAAAGDSAFLLVEDGHARGVIYLAPGSTPTAAYAAEELRDHLNQVSGADLPIVDVLPADAAMPVVLVGPSEAAAARGVTQEGLESEGYRIKSGDNWLALVGDDTDGPPRLNPRWWQRAPVRYGTLTAVYRFLESVCGVRWFMPGELGTVVPTRPTIRIPRVDRQGAPEFEDRLPRLRRHKNDPAFDAELSRWMLRVGFGRTVIGHFNHSFYFLTKNKTLQQKKPQIFAQLADGSRDFNTTSYGHGNLCLSEPDTLAEFTKMMRSWYDKHPNHREFSINPNDVWVPCMCERCLETLRPDLRQRIRAEAGMEKVRGTPRGSLPPDLRQEFIRASSQTYWEFVANVARQIEQSHPDRLVGVFGGYGGYGDPEVAAQANLPDNIAVCITKNRWSFWDPERRKTTRDMVTKWGRITPHVYVWEYYIWNWRGWSTRPKLAGYPVFFPHIVEEDIRFQRNQNVRGEKFQNESWAKDYPGLNHLMVYLTGRLLYNPDLDVDDLLDDYYHAFYGAARDDMKAFWEHAETCWMRDTSAFDPKTQSDRIIQTLYTAEDLRLFFSLLADAKGNVEPDSREFRRITMIEDEMAPLKARTSAATRIPDAFGTWQFRSDPDDRGVRENWFARDLPAQAAWQPVDVPAFLPESANGPFLGYGWYSAPFTVPESYRGRHLEIFFEAVDEQAWVYVNGQAVGEHSTASTGRPVAQLWDEPFLVEVPVGVLADDGRNRLTVRVHNSAAAAGIWKPVHLQVVGVDQPPLPQVASSAVFPAPAIDGTYHAEWADAAINLGMAKVTIGHDPRNLYLSFAVDEDGKAPLPSPLDGKGWYWGKTHGWYLPKADSNTIMIDLQPDPASPEHYVSILINASGQTFDAAYGDPAVTEPHQWISSADTAVKLRNGRGWSGTVAVPWKALGLRLTPGMEIQANISHWRAGQGATYWSPLPADWDHAQRRNRSHERFGTIVFPEH